MHYFGAPRRIRRTHRQDLPIRTSPPPTPTTRAGARNKGWRTSASFGNTAYAYNRFDGLGSATSATQTTSGRPHTFSFSAQPASLAPVYGNNTSYTPAGVLQELWLGNGLRNRPATTATSSLSSSGSASPARRFISVQCSSSFGWARKNARVSDAAEFLCSRQYVCERATQTRPSRGTSLLAVSRFVCASARLPR